MHACENLFQAALAAHQARRVEEPGGSVMHAGALSRWCLSACDAQAGLLEQEFEHFWTYKAPWAAERFLRRQCTLLSRLEPTREFVYTLRRHQIAVIAFIDTQVTNATAEGSNRIVRIVKNRASGYRHLDTLSDMIYLTVGDLDLPAQIPARFRTL